jgi:hypothetical protein
MMLETADGRHRTRSSLAGDDLPWWRSAVVYPNPRCCQIHAGGTASHLPGSSRFLRRRDWRHRLCIQTCYRGTSTHSLVDAGRRQAPPRERGRHLPGQPGDSDTASHLTTTTSCVRTCTSITWLNTHPVIAGGRFHAPHFVGRSGISAVETRREADVGLHRRQCLPTGATAASRVLPWTNTFVSSLARSYAGPRAIRLQTAGAVLFGGDLASGRAGC